MPEEEEPEPFSPESARLAIEEMFEALPKTKRMEYIGNLNEVLITLRRLIALTEIDPRKEVSA